MPRRTRRASSDDVFIVINPTTNGLRSSRPTVCTDTPTSVNLPVTRACLRHRSSRAARHPPRSSHASKTHGGPATHGRYERYRPLLFLQPSEELVPVEPQGSGRVGLVPVVRCQRRIQVRPGQLGWARTHLEREVARLQQHVTAFRLHRSLPEDLVELADEATDVSFEGARRSDGETDGNDEGADVADLEPTAPRRRPAGAMTNRMGRGTGLSQGTTMLVGLMAAATGGMKKPMSARRKTKNTTKQPAGPTKAPTSPLVQSPTATRRRGARCCVGAPDHEAAQRNVEALLGVDWTDRGDNGDSAREYGSDNRESRAVGCWGGASERDGRTGVDGRGIVTNDGGPPGEMMEPPGEMAEPLESFPDLPRAKTDWGLATASSPEGRGRQGVVWGKLTLSAASWYAILP